MTSNPPSDPKIPQPRQLPVDPANAALASQAIAFNEREDGSGQVRSGYLGLHDAMSAIGREELNRRWQQTLEELRQTGIAFGGYDETEKFARPWELDVEPLLIPNEEWEALVSGLQQRAELLNRLLIDLYGKQEAIKKGWLPPEWLLGNPQFRRVFHGIAPRVKQPLHFYAVDLARDEAGRWRVVRDRTDAPMGLGYALENRIATSAMLPAEIRNLHIRRLAPFFRTLQQSLRNLSDDRVSSPRIVLLSMGPDSPNFFEDAYLARYLGYTLAEGADLAVRNDRVFLKTLGGLLPIDVIFRRMNDLLCDPLSLRGDHAAGIPGLMAIAHLGNVAIANSLGSSLVESSSLMPFLPQIAQGWLGEELKLPSVKTEWLGRKDGVTKNLGPKQNLPSHYELLPAFPDIPTARPDHLPEFTASNSGSNDRATQGATREPAQWMMRQPVSHSVAGIWTNESVGPLPLTLRVYLVANGSGYTVMPGGLLRLDSNTKKLDEYVHDGTFCKDVWIPSPQPVKHQSLLNPARQAPKVSRTGAELSSRVADNLFWLGRNMERCQVGCRLLRQVVSLLTREDEPDESEDLARLVHCLAAQGQVEPGYAVEELKNGLPTLSSVLPSLAVSEHQAGSVRMSIANIHGNASLVRDRLSLDAWRIVRDIHLRMIKASQSAPFEMPELDDLLDELILYLSALDGLVSENMTRSPAWRFLDLGRRIERALGNAGLMEMLRTDPLQDEERVLQAMLEVADSMMTYRGRYLAGVHRIPALDLLITDETNPRSLVFQLKKISKHVSRLPGKSHLPFCEPEERIANSILHRLQSLEAKHLNGSLEPGSPVDRLLAAVNRQLPRLSELVSHKYLIHAGVPQQLAKGVVPE